MVEIRVALEDATGAHGLVKRLASMFDRPAVSVDVARNEVRVRSDWESEGVVQVIDVVESWLAAECVDWATLSIGERFYTMVGPSSRW